MRHILFRLAAFTLTASLLILGGCLGKGTTQRARFYHLHPLSTSGTETDFTATEGGIKIGVGPVKLAEYLNRPQIVTRTSPNELRLAEFHRWAEPLTENFSRVLRENLSILVSEDNIAVIPWTAAAPIDYQLAVEVNRFDGKLGGDGSLNVLWAVLTAKGNEVLSIRESSFSAVAAAEDYSALVAAMNQMLVDFSREAAGAIKAISQEASGQ